MNGNHCEVIYTPDGRYIISGDGEGKVCVWSFKTTKLLSRFQAHERAILSVQFLPHETSKVLTAGLDGVIKMWD